MKEKSYSLNMGQQDAQAFIRDERIDYQPFVAISDIHLVRKTIPATYQGLQDTINKFDEELWLDVDASARQHAKRHGSSFSYDNYAAGFAAGIAAVWEKIRDEVL